MTVGNGPAVRIPAPRDRQVLASSLRFGDTVEIDKTYAMVVAPPETFSGAHPRVKVSLIFDPNQASGLLTRNLEFELWETVTLIE
jgi:hypothetical protein